MAGLSTAPFMSVYDVTKHGVVALSESMFKEFESTGALIGVSVVCPGLINTSIMRSSRNRPAELSEEGKAGPMAQAFGQGLADRLTRGYPPSEVADQVLRGIREKRFYVVPAQPEVRGGGHDPRQGHHRAAEPDPRAGSYAPFGKSYRVAGFSTRTRWRTLSSGTQSLSRSNSTASSGFLLLLGRMRPVAAPHQALRHRLRVGLRDRDAIG